MSKNKEEVTQVKERRWRVPNKRAKDYANERKTKVHQHGDKEG